MLNAILEYSFLQNAILAGLLSSIICGVIGVIIVEKKLLMMGGGIAHTAYGGVGLGYLLGFEPVLGAGAFSVAAALLIGFIRRKNSGYTDVIISLLWSLGMALGIAFVGLMPGYPPDINSYLFGNILSVTKGDIYIILSITAVVLFSIMAFFNDWKAFLFDSRFSEIAGLKTNFLEYFLLVTVALSVVALIRVVGIILAIALLSAPAACAGLLVKSLKNRMVVASVLSFVFCFAGLSVSYYLSIPSGAAIVFVAVLTYFILLALNKIKGSN
ncbi:MAG: metal ABC transporter permease [Clostridia bacterium]|nr:metal ABC transporter permease [Clostridia bacterium]